MYEHQLGEPLTKRGMQALFAVAVPRTLGQRCRAELYDRWCYRLQQAAEARRIMWLPASGAAYTHVQFPTQRVEATLLRILENSPVPPTKQLEPRPAATTE